MTAFDKATDRLTRLYDGVYRIDNLHPTRDRDLYPGLLCSAYHNGSLHKPHWFRVARITSVFRPGRGRGRDCGLLFQVEERLHGNPAASRIAAEYANITDTPILPFKDAGTLTSLWLFSSDVEPLTNYMHGREMANAYCGPFDPLADSVGVYQFEALVSFLSLTNTPESSRESLRSRIDSLTSHFCEDWKADGYVRTGDASPALPFRVQLLHDYLQRGVMGNPQSLGLYPEQPATTHLVAPAVARSCSRIIETP